MDQGEVVNNSKKTKPQRKGAKDAKGRKENQPASVVAYSTVMSIRHAVGIGESA